MANKKTPAVSKPAQTAKHTVIANKAHHVREASVCLARNQPTAVKNQDVPKEKLVSTLSVAPKHARLQLQTAAKRVVSARPKDNHAPKTTKSTRLLAEERLDSHVAFQSPISARL